METRIVKLKGEFNNIISIRNTVKNIFDILQVRIDKLKMFYAEFIQSSKNDMFVFGLDSFRFQSRLIDIEYDDMKRLFLAINNRMYCEYFKLHKIIVEYILTHIDDKKITDIVKVNNYPVYKDLEPYKDYKFETILDIHENILNLLNILMASLDNKENELAIHKSKQRIGLNIDNFITTFTFNIVVLREKIGMFITYIEFFHKMHTKYLQRFSNKIHLMHTHINNDVKFDESMDKNNSEDFFEDLLGDKPVNKSEPNSENKKDKHNAHVFHMSLNSDFNVESDKESSLTGDSVSSILTDNNDYRPTSPGSSTTSNTLSNILVTNIINRNRTDSSIESKRSLKDIIKSNVSKMSNMFQICKLNQTNIIDPQLSHTDLNDLGSKSDSTIGKEENQNENENIGLLIDDSREELCLENIKINNDTQTDIIFNINEFINPNQIHDDNSNEVCMEENVIGVVLEIPAIETPIVEDAPTTVLEEAPTVEVAPATVVEEVPTVEETPAVEEVKPEVVEALTVEEVTIVEDKNETNEELVIPESNISESHII
jgi:hypothetical protein